MRSILVVRDSDEFSRVLTENGLDVINCPAIETVPVDDLSDFEKKIVSLNDYDGIFLTSRVSAEILRRAIRENRVNYSGQVFILGGKSLEILSGEKLRLFFGKSFNTAVELLAAIPVETLENKRFLFVRGDKSLETIPRYLRKFAAVDETIVYQTKPIAISSDKVSAIRAKFDDREIICVCFFSPSGAESFIEQFGGEILHQTKIVVIGTTTALFLEKRGYKIDFVSKNAAAKDYAAELAEHLKN